MSISDTNGNECTQAELNLIYEWAEICPVLPSITCVLTYSETIKLAKWCLVGTPTIELAHRTFPTLRFRRDETVTAVLDFFSTEQAVRDALA